MPHERESLIEISVNEWMRLILFVGGHKNPMTEQLLASSIIHDRVTLSGVFT